MKKIIFILLCGLQLAYGQSVRKTQVAYDQIYYNSALVAGAVTDFNFGNTSSVTLSGSNITQIVDGIGSVVSAQATPAAQPTYFTIGGPNNTGYANFNGSQTLTGNLLSSSTSFTIFIVRRVAASTGNMSSFLNGTVNTNGYGMADNQSNYTGGVFPAVSGASAADNYTFLNKWEVVALTHSPGVTYIYNTVGHKLLTNSAINPVTPTGAHSIGASAGAGYVNFNGDISRILLYATQLTDAQILQNCYELSASFPIPINLIAGGDSKFFGTGGLPNAPSQTLTQLQASTSYSMLINTAVSGRTSTDVINNFSTEVTPNYLNRAKNVYFFMIGQNDPGTAVAAENNIIKLSRLARRDGFKVVMCTDIYIGTNITGFAAANLKKDTINNFFRSNPQYFDGIADANVLPHASAANMAPGIYSGDGVHPTSLLASEIAGVAELVIKNINTDKSYEPSLINATGLPLSTGVTGMLGYAHGGLNINTSWTKGSIFFAGTSSFSEDNSHFFYDATNFRLGLLNAAPAYTLDFGNNFNASLPMMRIGSWLIEPLSQGNLYTVDNLFWNGAAYKYLNTGAAAGLAILNGQVGFVAIISGSGGASATFAMPGKFDNDNSGSFSAGGNINTATGSITGSKFAVLGTGITLFKPTPTAINATATATTAQMMAGYITSTSAAAVTITTPTATALATAINGTGQGTSFQFTIDNTAGANTVTLALGSGFTLLNDITGSTTLTVPSGTTGVATWIITFVSTTAATISRIQ